MTSVHYQGVLSDGAGRAALFRWLEEYAAEQGWGRLRVNDADAGLSGIVLSPVGELEPVPFLFDEIGRLHALGDLIVPGGESVLSVAVKTHYAGIGAHIAFVRFLRVVQREYMPGLSVRDESGYWDHGDETRLRRYFARLDRIMDGFVEHLTNDVAPVPDGGTDNLLDCITLAANMTFRQETSRPCGGGCE
jgi:hypothetical protein